MDNNTLKALSKISRKTICDLIESNILDFSSNTKNILNLILIL